MASAARLGLQPSAIRSDVVHGPWISGQIKATFDAANRPRVSSSLGLGFCLPSEHKTLAATPAAFGWDDAESKGFDVLANLIKGNCCLLRDKYSAEQARIDGEMRPVSLLEGIKNRMTAATCKGDAISERFFENFKYFKATLSDLQWRVVRAVHASLLPQIYGDDFELHKERLMKKYKIKDFSPAVFAEFPRRWGKTYIAAMIEASAMDCIGGGSCVVGAYRPQSRFFLATVKSFFMQIPGAEQRVILDSKDEFVVQPCMHAEGIAGAVNGEHSRCVAHSGNADGSRGQTVARMWYDEASFVRAEHIMSNAFANMKLKNTVVIMISSPPTNHDNVFYMLTQFTEIFTVVTAHLLCDDCMEKKATECPHVILPKPFWITSGKRGDDIDDTMKALDPRRYATELLGTANNPNVPVFRREDLSRLKDLGAVTLSSKPSVVYLSMDCSGGGGQTQSDTAIIVACYDEQSRLVIMSMEAVQVTSAYTNTDMMRDYAKLLKAWPLTNGAKVVAIIETNFGGSAMAGDMLHALKTEGIYVEAFSKVEEKGRDVNLHITDQDKETMVTCIRETMSRDMVVFMDQCRSKSIPSPVERLLGEMKTFERKLKPNSTRYRYTGKPSNKDDMVMTLLELNYFSKVHRDRHGLSTASIMKALAENEDRKMKIVDMIRGRQG